MMGVGVVYYGHVDGCLCIYKLCTLFFFYPRDSLLKRTN